MTDKDVVISPIDRIRLVLRGRDAVRSKEDLAALLREFDALVSADKRALPKPKVSQCDECVGARYVRADRYSDKMILCPSCS